ncbi:MAG: tonB [Proteobacteria bacterium]|nr:tonB [Pseudomonadota bacterium]
MRLARDFDISPRLRWVAVFAALVGHGAVAFGLLMSAFSQPHFVTPGVLAVKWLSGQMPAPAMPEPAFKPRPLPMMLHRLPMAQREPAPLTAAAPVAPVSTGGASEAEPPAAASSAASGSSHAEPPAGVAPRFDADYLSNPAPAYPSVSRARGEQGKVFLRVFVSPRGDAQEVHVHTGSGYERLDLAALEAVQHWKFVPARQGENAVAAWVVVPISFTLRR